MIGIFNSLTINSTEFLRPSDVSYEREDIYAGQYTTCTGAIRADRVGWKYSDITLEWDTLPDSMLQVLAALSSSVTMTFTDSDGSHSETVIRKGFVNTPTRFTTSGGEAVWKDVRVVFTFIDSH